MRLQDGHIGVVYWYEEEIMPMTDEQRQYIIDQDAKAAMYALIQSSTLNPNQGYVDVQAEYQKARRNGEVRAENIRKTRVLKQTHHQVGQVESIEELIEIEKKPHFRGWENPDIVSSLINYKTNK
jgi:cell fate (sporulation/competence/biofilm development) regulator YlbF (YheA/YmcA/DUF963 family)